MTIEPLGWDDIDAVMARHGYRVAARYESLDDCPAKVVDAVGDAVEPSENMLYALESRMLEHIHLPPRHVPARYANLSPSITVYEWKAHETWFGVSIEDMRANHAMLAHYWDRLFARYKYVIEEDGRTAKPREPQTDKERREAVDGIQTLGQYDLRLRSEGLSDFDRGRLVERLATEMLLLAEEWEYES